VHITWSKKMTHLGTTLDKKINKTDSDIVLELFLTDNGIQDVASLKDDKGIHLSSVDPGILTAMEMILGNPTGLMEMLKALYLRAIPQEEVKEQPTSTPDTVPKLQPGLSPQENSEILKGKLQETCGFTGIAIYMEACKKQGITGSTGESITNEQWLSVCALLSAAVEQQAKGVSPEDIVKGLRG